MTREAALARKAALLNDREWSKRYVAGGAAERQEMRELHATLAGVPAPIGTPQSIAQARLTTLVADPAWRQRYMDGDATARAEATELHHAIVAAENDQ